MNARQLIEALKLVPEKTEVYAVNDEIGEVPVLEFSYFSEEGVVLLALEESQWDEEEPKLDPMTGKPLDEDEDDEALGEVIIISDEIDPETLAKHPALSAAKEKKKPHPVVIDADFTPVVDDVERGV